MYDNGIRKILVVCGAGIATSTVVSSKIREELAKKGIRNVIVKQTSLSAMFNIVSNYDVLVQIASCSNEIGIPVVNGVPVLTGRGKEAVIEEIIEILNTKRC